MYQIGLLDVYTDEVFAEILKETPEGMRLRRASSYEVEEQKRVVDGVDFIMTGWAPVPSDLIIGNKNLKLIQKFGIGYDKIDINTAAKQGVPVAICAGCNSNPVAELCILLMLGVLRHVWYAMKELHDGNFRKSELRGVNYQLRGKSVGLIGMGNIGHALVRYLQPFECKIHYFDIRRLSLEEEVSLGIEYQSIEEIFSICDIVSLHVPHTSMTNRFVNKKLLSLMKPTSILINTARGELIEESDLIDALQDNQILGAGLDVMAKEPPDPGSPLFQHPRVLITPHFGGSVIDNVSNVAKHCFTNIQRIINNEPLPENDHVNRKLMEGFRND